MIALFIAAFLALPLVVLRGRTLRTYLTVEPITYLVAWLIWLRIQGAVDPVLILAVFAVLKLAIFSIFLAAGKDVRWSATRGALLAAIVYFAAIPAMTRVPIDGDEPFYLLVTESIVRDGDLDLANQYRELGLSATRRPDLKPQFGDPVGPAGEQYSRHEPFFSFLLVPGYLLGGLHGAVATIALFGALLARSTVRLFEEAGVSQRTTRALFPLIAFGAPILWYSTRLWPEVPGAFLFVEAVRGVWHRRTMRWIPALLLLALLKLRFILLAVVLVARSLSWLRSTRARVIAVCIGVVPLLLAWLIGGSASGVHEWRELLPEPPVDYLVGLFGLILDGAAGIAFRAPIYLLGLVALTRWSTLPGIVRLGVSSSLLYIIYLLPRDEWHGGWSPPLRYIVVLLPFLAAAAAVALERRRTLVMPLISLWTMGLVAHGLAYPWRLFHIANGENAIGEWLSRMFASDFSRLFPSFIRVNDAGIVASVAFVALLLIARGAPASGRLVRARLARAGGTPADQPPGWRRSSVLFAPVAALLLPLFVDVGQRPGGVVHFEDAHVTHRGGALYPHEYTVARYAYRGGWWLRAGESVSFLARGGPAVLHYQVERGRGMIELAGRAYELPATGKDYGQIRVEIPRDGRTELRCLSGAVNLDRLEGLGS